MEEKNAKFDLIKAFKATFSSQISGLNWCSQTI